MNADLAAQARSALVSATAFLVSHQADDGGWHSQTYGQLKDGAGVTALALYAISFLPREIQQKLSPHVARGFAFLARGLARRKTIASPDGSLDYPTYASALWLTARRRLELPAPQEEVGLVRKYLLAAQVAEDRGFQPDHPQYGGWDFLGQEDAQGITTGTNVSVTRHVLAALADGTSDERTAAAISRAKTWVLRCQQEDGGFCFTTEPMSLNNKAGFRDEQRMQPRSYGTATCDAILALLEAGMKPADEPLVKAVAWLSERKSLELVPGFEDAPPELGWQRGLRFYYYEGLAQALSLLPEPEQTARREALLALLIKEQRSADGSFANESDRMRENDPLIATSLAIGALVNASG